MFVAAVGPRPFAGVLAIAIGSIGMLGKLYSEVIESIDMHVVEALQANGANKIQVLFYGVIPQIIPEFPILCLQVYISIMFMYPYG